MAVSARLMQLRLVRQLAWTTWNSTWLVSAATAGIIMLQHYYNNI